MLQNLSRIWQALRAGNELRHATTWKRVDAAAKALSLLLFSLGGIAYANGWLPFEITEAQALELATAIATLVNLASLYWGLATSRRVGMPSKPAPEALAQASDPDLPPADYQKAQAKPNPRPRQPATARQPAAPRRHPGDDPGLDRFS